MSTNQNNRACIAVSDEAKAVPQVKSDGTARASHFILKGEHMRLFIMAMLVIPSTALAGWSLYEIFLPNGLTNLEIAQ
ncbi:MAG: glucan biosynthesis glucosyltransferase H, partial [Pseudomonadota bacterium]|nr:glucan biosynthesis glucosyltransferase H [Pseudomonadota bacterium]